jgi:hypothetical protein
MEQQQYRAQLPERRRRYYITGQDQRVAGLGFHRQTGDFLSRTAETLARCRALFDRLDREEEAQKQCRSKVYGGHRPPMEIYLFMSSTRKTFGFTADSGGANLPIELAPWEEAGSVTDPTWLATDVTDAIKRDGFYVMSKT